MPLRRLEMHTPTRTHVEHACAGFDVWCYQHHADTFLSSQDNDDKKIFYDTRHFMLPHRLFWLITHHGTQAVDAWWKQEGRALFWDEAHHLPHPELAHLLHYAAQKRAYTLIIWALEQGWGVEVCDGGWLERTPLHVLIAEGLPHNDEEAPLYERIFDKLLTPDIVNSPDHEGCTPLALLLRNGCHLDSECDMLFHFCQKLFLSGADIQSSDTQGYTPLHHYMTAATGSKKKTLRLLSFLFDAGADPLAGATRPPFVTPYALLYGKEAYPRGEDLTEAMRQCMDAVLRQQNAQALMETLHVEGDTFSHPKKTEQGGRPRGRL